MSKNDRILTKVQGGIFKRDELDEAALDQRPEMYDSLTDNPVAEVIRNSENVYNNIFRLLRYVDIEVNLPAATFDPFFFILIPGVAFFSEEHKVKGRIPIIEIYTGLIGDEVVIPNANTNFETFSSVIRNYSEVISGRFTIRAYIYDVLFKFR